MSKKKYQKDVIYDDNQKDVINDDIINSEQAKEKVIEPQTKKAGRTAMTDEEKQEKYKIYLANIERRNKIIETEANGAKLLKTAPYDKWIISMPSGEDSHETFKRLTKMRMIKMFKMFETMKNLSHYKHTDDQTTKIINDLLSKVSELEVSLTVKNSEITDYEI